MNGVLPVRGTELETLICLSSLDLSLSAVAFKGNKSFKGDKDGWISNKKNARLTCSECSFIVISGHELQHKRQIKSYNNKYIRVKWR